MTYEAWRISYQSSEQAARAAYAECDELRSKIEAAESDAAHQKALADSALRVAEGWEEKCNALCADKATLQQMTYSLKDRLEAAEKERDVLKAKIEQMEPVAWAATDETCRIVEALSFNQSRRFDTPLGILPGAKGE